jgi:xanthine dehydrogenase accessory factor
MREAFGELLRYLKEGRRVALCRIVKQVGSAPRHIGTKCLVLEDGTVVGTIGGGMLEWRVREEAKESIASGIPRLVHFELKGEDIAKTDMLCGGIADVYVEPIAPEGDTISFFERVAEMIREDRRGVLLTRLWEDPPIEGKARILLAIEQIPSGLPRELEPLARELHPNEPKLIELEKGKIFWEPLMPPEVLYLFGAGHVSTFVASLASMVGFHVVVIDDREEFANRGRFPSAKEILVLPIEEAISRLDPGPHSYVAIITRGHIHDAAALRGVIRKEFAYIGMIGSKRKRAVVYNGLMKEGISKDLLERVRCPIGLDIGAETPEEIAVSIVAELIKVRNETRKGARVQKGASSP